MACGTTVKESPVIEGECFSPLEGTTSAVSYYLDSQHWMESSLNQTKRKGLQCIFIPLFTCLMKSTKVQTLGAVALHATTACTDDASIVVLSPLSWAIV